MIEYILPSLPLKKIVIGSALAATGYFAYQSMPTSKIRAKMLKVFKAGKLYAMKTSFGKPVEVFPVVRGVNIGRDKTEITFTIPFSVNPENVEKSRWLFEQQFGENIELERDGKRFTLLIFHAKLSSNIVYNYDKIRPYVENMALPIFVGYSNRGPVIYNMVDEPHLMIGGFTGSGKSAGLRSILTTLILTKSSNELTLYLADLKRTEFHVFKYVKHVKTVANSIDEIADICYELNAEMNKREKLIERADCVHIDEYNGYTDEKIPYIIFVIDEYSLITDEKEITTIIEKIGAIGRALGVYLIISQQRHDSQTISSRLKNNLTVTLAYRTRDEINSRVLLGNDKAAKIPKGTPGRAIFAGSREIEIQSPFLSVAAAKKLLAPFKRNQNEVNNDEGTGQIDFERFAAF